MECVRRINGSLCGEPAELKWNIPLCRSCSGFVWMTGKAGALDLVAQAIDRAGGEIEWDYGITYYLLLPNGNIKIGHVRKTDQLATRWQDVSYDNGGRVTPLATEIGGSLKEAYRHAKLAKYRVWVHGEQFRPTPEVIRAASIGHTPMGYKAVAQYAAWQPRASTLAKWSQA